MSEAPETVAIRWFVGVGTIAPPRVPALVRAALAYVPAIALQVAGLVALYFVPFAQPYSCENPCHGQGNHTFCHTCASGTEFNFTALVIFSGAAFCGCAA